MKATRFFNRCLTGMGFCLFLAFAGADMDTYTTTQFVVAKLVAAGGIWALLRRARRLNAEGRL